MNAVMIEDVLGDLVDLHYYCSDSCARTDPAYAGWYGCVEGDEECENCGTDCGEPMSNRVSRQGSWGCGIAGCESCFEDREPVND